MRTRRCSSCSRTSESRTRARDASLPRRGSRREGVRDPANRRLRIVMTALPWGKEGWKDGQSEWVGQFSRLGGSRINYEFKSRVHYAASFRLFEDSTVFHGICSENAGCEEATRGWEWLEPARTGRFCPDSQILDADRPVDSTGTPRTILTPFRRHNRFKPADRCRNHWGWCQSWA